MTERDLLGDVRLPVCTLARGAWSLGQSGRPALDAILTSQRPYRGGRSWRRLKAQADAVWRAAEQRGRPIYGRPPEPAGLLRLVDWRMGDGSGGNGDLRLHLQPTWFWALLGSNVAAANSIPSRDWGLAAAERLDPRAIAGSALANPLTVNLAIVARDEGTDDLWLLIQRRGQLVRSSSEAFQVSAAGFVDRADHVPRSALPAPWRTAIREAREETGLDLDPADIHFLSLCRTTVHFVPGLCAVAELPFTPPLAELRTDHDQFEVDGYEYWRFTPEAVFQRVWDAGGWRALVPLGAAAIVHALARYFGDDRVRHTWYTSAEVTKP